MHRAYLSLGSNIDPERNLVAAVRRLANIAEVRKVSSVWESAPVGRLDQPRFLNAAVLLLTPLTSSAIRREIIRPIETELMRVRDPGDRNGPRTIDLDLSLFDDGAFEEEGHHVPDPDLLSRPFVAVPLAELDPNYRHPLTNQTLSEIVRLFGDLTGKLTLRKDIHLSSSEPEISEPET